MMTMVLANYQPQCTIVSHGNQPARGGDIPEEVGDTSREYRPVQKQADGNDGFFCPAFPPNQHSQHRNAQGDGCQNQRVGPRDNVSAGVQAEQHQDEEPDSQKSPAKVDARKQRPVGDLGWNVDKIPHQDPRRHHNRHLDEKRQPPPQRRPVVDKPAQHSTQHRPRPIRNISHPLNHASLLQRHQIRRQKRTDTHQPATPNARNNPPQNHPPLIRSQPTHKVPKRKHGVAKHQPRTAAKDVGQAPRQRLECGVGN